MRQYSHTAGFRDHFNRSHIDSHVHSRMLTLLDGYAPLKNPNNGETGVVLPYCLHVIGKVIFVKHLTSVNKDREKSPKKDLY